MVDGDPLHEPAAHRQADEVRALEAEVVEHAERVGDEVVARVARLTRRIGRGAAGVAMVVADDEAAGLGEPLAERLLPAVHRAARAHDEQHRRVGRIAEGADAQRRPVDVDEAQPFGTR